MLCQRTFSSVFRPVFFFTQLKCTVSLRAFGTLKIERELREMMTTGGPWPGPDPYIVGKGRTCCELRVLVAQWNCCAQWRRNVERVWRIANSAECYRVRPSVKSAGHCTAANSEGDKDTHAV